MKMITAKLGSMRKPAEFVVYPFKAGQTFLDIQSDKRFCRFDIATGHGILSRAKDYARSADLHPTAGATLIEVPMDVVAAALAAQPRSGDTIANGVGIIA